MCRLADEIENAFPARPGGESVDRRRHGVAVAVVVAAAGVAAVVGARTLTVEQVKLDPR